MKKMFLILLTVAVGSVAMAGTPGMAVVKNGSTFRLHYKATEESDVRVIIYDESNQIVFSETFKDCDGFIRPYNFEKLRSGKYKIELKDQKGTKIEELVYNSKPAEKYAQVVKLPDEEKYALLVPDNGSKYLSVNIYNQDGTSVYSKRQPVSGDFAQVFDLDGLKSFTLVVHDSKGLSKTIQR